MRNAPIKCYLLSVQMNINRHRFDHRFNHFVCWANDNNNNVDDDDDDDSWQTVPENSLPHNKNEFKIHTD